jgi:cation diffusion facilitator family transporter
MARGRTRQPDASTPTVLVAGGANLLISAAKLVAGLASGSSAMLAEAAHSMADTLNQGFLMAAIWRSRKPADRDHPFGYGMERYFWSLLAAVGIFVLGAGFAVYQGVTTLAGSGETGSPTWSYVVLGVAFVFEGASLVRAVWQLRHEARERQSGVRHHFVHDAEPALRAVVTEDSVALLGLLLAAVGLGLDQATGSRVWDGLASLGIAALLIVVAIGLGRQNQRYLIGKSLDPAVVKGISEEIARAPGIDAVLELLTMRLAPDEVLVAARVDLSDTAAGDELELAADDIEARVRDRFAEVRHVFLDPTPPPGTAGPG